VLTREGGGGVSRFTVVLIREGGGRVTLRSSTIFREGGGLSRSTGAASVDLGGPVLPRLHFAAAAAGPLPRYTQSLLALLVQKHEY
jgi:hypothetical protein